jgi:NEDD8-activating enzyme E1 regulatory subunit
MDPTEHTHIPYVVILVRALEDWKKSVSRSFCREMDRRLHASVPSSQHNNLPPQNKAEKDAFKKLIDSMRVKPDEENFDEALAQAYRAWTPTTVPSEISDLFQDPAIATLTPTSPPFFHLVAALREFTLQPPHTLPLSSTLPDMKADTKNYIDLQKLYKARAEEEKRAFKTHLKVPVAPKEVDLFVKNAHAVRFLRGTKYGALLSDKAALGIYNPPPFNVTIES